MDDGLRTIVATIDGDRRLVRCGEKRAAVWVAAGWEYADLPDPDDGHDCPDCPYVAKTAAGLASHARTHDDD